MTAMETVAFYSYKGGVGRTLLVANTAQFLAISGRSVMVLDLDLEAPGLHQKLGDGDVWKRARDGKLRGAVDELLDILQGSTRSRASLRRVVVEVDLPSGARGSLRLVPAGAAPSHSYWRALERLNLVLRSNAQDGGLPEAVLELQERIEKEFSPDFLLIDSRTGITELGGLATSILADRVVCLTTTAPESVEGTRVVAEAMRAAPRLASQEPLRVDFLLTRVTSGSQREPHIARIIEVLGGAVALLPHDSAITNVERVFSGSATYDHDGALRDDEEAGTELFGATLRWIAESFPIHKTEAEVARRRMEAVHGAWRYLTRTTERVRGGTASRAAWPVEQLRGRVRFGSAKNGRLADIVAYDRAASDAEARPLLVVEYVAGEDRDAVAHWWLSEARIPVLAILSTRSQGAGSEQRLYSGKAAWDSRVRFSERWDLPMPHDFTALSDPTDSSVDTLLDAVRRGHPEYLDRIVTEWVRSSAAGLHGGAPWRPDVAKKIIDGLARVSDVELAKRILWAASRGSGHRGMWLGDGDDWLDQQVLSEMFTPLFWRLPPEASIELARNAGRPFGPPAGLFALSLLARDMGLYYQPDATFRTEGQRILDESQRDQWVDSDRGLYALAPVFKKTEISFEISEETPPLAAPKVPLANDRPAPSLERLLSDRVATRRLVTTGLLGNYEPRNGRVVLYSTAIALCADKLALKPRHVAGVTLIHETLHGLAHLGRDLDGRMWPEFALPDASEPGFEPSWFHEAIAQFFTRFHILKLRDNDLLQAFEVLSEKQMPAYRSWQRLRYLSAEDVRVWFMGVRRGVGHPGVSHALLYWEDTRSGE
jgi:cellulose biosynthesis protein BcsQ